MLYQRRTKTVLHRVSGALSGVLAMCASVLVAMLMCAIVFDVARRELTGRSISGLLEYSEVAMVFIVYLSLAHGQSTRSHVAVDLFLTRLAPRTRTIVDTAVLMAMAAFLLWFAFHTGVAALDSFERREARTGLASVPIWPAKVAIPIGVFAMAVQCLAQVQDNLRTMRWSRNEPLTEQSWHESWVED